ncbi:cytochrome P450 [Streptomyces sp. DSM 44915]|uniref:Cytochrome P450 n=1 Tax=Streptomyces chisholmiae TaxID=3075540 RepID=A0ABU2JXE8_9ACTN|nr:cytochrome P450 [Streptomyces sp. DSM 44915]MDT0269639.1 cytochrome P450 [Streptomyces sp. DSM 44915]
MATDTAARPYPFGESRELAPHPAYAVLRGGPPVRVRLPHGEECWLAIGYEDVRTVLTDPRFSVAEAMRRDHPRMRPTPRRGGGMVATDPPEQTRLRQVVSRRFTARRVAQLRPHIRQVAEEMLTALRAGPRPADLVETFATPLAVRVSCDLLGLPEDGRQRFGDWAGTVLSYQSSDEEVAAGTMAFRAYLTELAHTRRTDPRDDVLTDLVQASTAGTINDHELFAVAAELLNAGFESTAVQLANVGFLLASRPEVAARLRERPELIPDAVEELLRFVPLVLGSTLPRYATEDVLLGETLITAGSPVMVDVSAANRDDRTFPQPDELRLDARERGGHLAFGAGPHYCLGAPLAREELRIALELLVTELPGLRLAVPQGEVPWRAGSLLSGPRRLPVTW